MTRAKQWIQSGSCLGDFCVLFFFELPLTGNHQSDRLICCLGLCHKIQPGTNLLDSFLFITLFGITMSVETTVILGITK